MKINIIKTSVTAFLVGAMLVPAFAFAQTVPATDGQNTGGATPTSTTPPTAGQNTGGATATAAVPATGGQNTGGATASAPATGGQNTGGATASSSVPPTAGQNTGGATTGVPATGGQNTGGATTGAPATGGQNTGGATAGTTVTPPTSNSVGGGYTSTSGGSGSIVGTPSLPLLVNISDCNYLTTYLKIGRANPVIEVTKLQNFLKNNEAMNIAVTGIFDQATFDAVSTFQVKYTADVLTPWGIKNPTGYVYYTTSKKINEFYCKKNFALTPSQIAEIEAYRTSVINGTSEAVNGDVGISNPSSTKTPSSSTIAKNSTSTDNSQVGAVAKTSVASKIWNFIKRIFGR